MVAYVIAEVKVHDAAVYARYAALAARTHPLYGGRVLAAGGRTERLSGDWTPDRIAVIGFESIDMAMAWFNSPEYEEAKAVRGDAADVRVIVTEGR